MRAAPILLALALIWPLAAHAQGTDITFGGLKQDTSLPVEVTADSLQVDQANGAATFDGNVLIAQGDMRLSARPCSCRLCPDRWPHRRAARDRGCHLRDARRSGRGAAGGL